MRKCLLLALLTLAAPAPAAAAPDFIPPPLSRKDIPSGTIRSAPAPAPQPVAAPAAPAPTPAAPAKRPALSVLSPLRPGWTDGEGQSALTSLMVDCVQSPWASRFKADQKRAATVQVQEPVDSTGERIAVAPLAAQARKLLAAAGLASPSGGAPDFVLTSVVLALHDGRIGRDDEVVQSYLLGLSLVSVTSGEKVWMDLFHLRKQISDARSGRPTVTLLKPDSVVDITGDFSAYDAWLVAGKLAKDLLARPWIDRAGRPALRFAPLQNRARTAIPERYISLQVERALVRDGRVSVLCRADERPASVAAGASSHLISGWITELSEGALRMVSVSMQAAGVDSGQKVWMKVESVKKLVEKRA